jgi:hypothetical protein
MAVDAYVWRWNGAGVALEWRWSGAGVALKGMVCFESSRANKRQKRREFSLPRSLRVGARAASELDYRLVTSPLRSGCYET